MKALYVVLGAIIGPILGCIAGFGAALVAMSLGPARYDGSYGMREMLVCLPVGAILGLIGGIVVARNISR